jgi:hypothetical protein
VTAAVAGIDLQEHSMMGVGIVVVNQYVPRLELLALAGLDVLVVVQESVVVDGVVGAAIKPDGSARRVAVRVVLLPVVEALGVVAVIVGCDVGEGVVADDHMIGTTPDKDSSIAAKVVGAVGHVPEGVVGKGQVGDCLAQRLSSIAALSVGLNAAPVKDAAGRGRAADGGIRLEVGEDVGAIVGTSEGGSRLACNPYSPGVEEHRRRQVIGSGSRKDNGISLRHGCDAAPDCWGVVGFSVTPGAPVCPRIPGASGGGQRKNCKKNCQAFFRRPPSSCHASRVGEGVKGSLIFVCVRNGNSRW